MSSVTNISETMQFGEVLGQLGYSFEQFMNILEPKIDPTANLARNVIAEMSLADAAKKYLEHVTAVNPQTTYDTYEPIIKDLVNYMLQSWQQREFQGQYAGLVTKDDIEMFLSWRCPKQSDNQVNSYTYNKMLSIVSTFFSYLMRNDIILKSPIERGMRKQEGQVQIRFLTKDEQRKVLKQALKNKSTGKRDFVIIFMALHTGLRLKEIPQVTIGSIDFQHSIINIPERKGNKAGVAYLNPEVKKVLMKYIKDERLYPFQSIRSAYDEPLFLSAKGPTGFQQISKKGIERMINRVFRAAGISSGATHRLRHSFAVNLLQSGHNMIEIMTLLGHKRISTTVRYLHLDNKDILRKLNSNYKLAFLSIQEMLKYVEDSELDGIKKLMERLSIEDGDNDE